MPSSSLQRHTRVALLALPLAWLVGAACTLDTSGALPEAPTGAGGSTSSAGGDGGSLLGCEVHADCPGFTDVCLAVACNDSVCVSSVKTGEPCGEDAFCNVEGECLLTLGTECTDASECNSAQCVDGVCCQSACDQLCEQCNDTGSCEPVAAAADPIDECMPGVCDGGRGCASGADGFAFGFGTLGDQRILAVATTPTGEVFIGGENDGELDVSGTPVGPDNSLDGWVAKRNADGSHAWVTYFPGNNIESVTALGSDTMGNAYLCGTFRDEIDIGGTTQSSNGNTDDIFVAKLSGSSGAEMWSRVFGSGSDDACHGLAVDPATGDVVIVGEFQSTVDFGGTNAVSTGNEDIFVVRLAAANGSTVWVQDFGGGGLQIARSAAFAPTGQVIVGGVFDTTFTLGATVYDPLGGQDAWVAELAGADGELQWSTVLGNDGSEVELYAVAVGPDGEIALGGSFSDTIDFGGGSFTAGGNSDGFLVELDGGGQYRRSRQFGSDGDDQVAAVAIDTTGAVVFGGMIKGPVDYAGGTIPFEGDEDAFVAKLSVDGVELWGRAVGDGGKEQIRGVAVTPNRTIMAGGYFDSSYTADGMTFSATNIDAMFLMLLP